MMISDICLLFWGHPVQ